LKVLTTMECLSPIDFPNRAYLSLASCRLTKLWIDYFGDEAETTLPDLERLSLSKNRLETIANQSFTKTTNLEYLDLSYNNIASLERAAFEGLSSLEQLLLDHNRLSTIDLVAFKPCANLSRLVISENSLVSMTAREGTTLNVQLLDITDNRLTDIAAIRYFPKLIVLGLSRNRALILDDYTFYHNRELGWLEMRAIGLEIRANFNSFQNRFTKNHFKLRANFDFLARMNKLEALYFDDNNLIDVEEQLPYLPRLITLSLVNSKLRRFYLAGTSQKFPQLKTLSLDRNYFSDEQLRDFRSALMGKYTKSSDDNLLQTKSFNFTDIPDLKLMNCSKSVRKVMSQPEYVKYVEDENLTVWLGLTVIVLFFILLMIVFSWICKKCCSSSAPSSSGTKIKEVTTPSEGDDIYENDEDYKSMS
jgi:Leucine rich repeat